MNLPSFSTFQHQPKSAYQLPMVPYLTHPQTNSSLDQLNLSRTVLLKNLSSDLSLNDLLSEIDHGPIEYCKMFTTQSPQHLKGLLQVKTCYISFVNTHISVSFFQKYAKNSYNLRILKEKLKDSKHLKISLNESCSSSSFSYNSAGPVGANNLCKQDFIKLKTLNYILEYNATRCILVKFETPSSENLQKIKEEFRSRCSKMGEIEDFKSSVNDESRVIKICVHFTSIDAAIKTYEFYSKRILLDLRNLLDAEDVTKLPSKCVSVSFHRDRCDRTEIPVYSRPPNPSFRRNESSQTSISSSPTLSKHHSNFHSRLGANDFGSPSAQASAPYPPTLEESSPLSPLSDHSAPDIEYTAMNNAAPSTDGLLDGHRDANDELISGDEEQQFGRGKVSNSFPSSQSLESAGQESIIDSQLSSPANAPALLAPSNGRFHPVHEFSDTQSIQSGFPYPSLASTLSLPMNAMNPYQYNPDPFNIGNRTIFLGNLHPNTQVEEIANNVRAGGLVENINFHKGKRMCFITFVDPAVALKFYLNHQVLHRLIIHGNDVKVSWGRNHSGPLSREIALAVTAGASRNVYIGVRPSKDSKTPAASLPGEETLRADFSKFGELEQVNFYHNKDCGFINFMNIMSAIKLVDMFDFGNVEAINKIAGDNGEFYNRYKNFKISFGKDRCGNPPKFSFRKKNTSIDRMKDGAEVFEDPHPERSRQQTPNSHINASTRSMLWSLGSVRPHQRNFLMI